MQVHDDNKCVGFQSVLLMNKVLASLHLAIAPVAVVAAAAVVVEVALHLGMGLVESCQTQ